MKNKIKILIAFICTIVLGLAVLAKQPIRAITGADWSAGNIIDDAVFTNTGSMSVAQIQAFLNSKVPVCDTWGTGGSTPTARANYVRSIGYSVPLTCLRDFYEVPKIEPGNWTPANNYGGAPIPAGAKSAAEIIYDAAQQYHISPQVLLVKIGTESAGPLTSDNWPTPNQFTYAMGSHCPDSGPNGTANCDPNYAGFSIQMYSAAKLLRYYIDNMDKPWWPYRVPYQNNTISYAVSSNCGASSVYIANRATAALYTYTPYQPNQAALNNLYGYGDSCSAYGNRNFWTTFSNWFGSTNAVNGTISISKPLSTNVETGTVTVGETLSASYEVSNSADYDIAVGGLGICAKINGKNYDLGFSSQNTITSKGSKIISYSKTLDQSGNLDLFICSYNDQLGGWASSTYPYNTNGFSRSLIFTVKDNPLITSGITITPSKSVLGQSITASFSVQNSSNIAVDIGSIVVAMRDPNGKNADFSPDANVSIPANSTYTYSKKQILSTIGSYTYFISNYKNNKWDNSYPKSSDSSIIREGVFLVGDNPLITTGISLSPKNPVVGQSVTATFSILNASDNAINIGTVALAGRNPNGKNADFESDVDVTIPANSTYTYSKLKIHDTAGKYYYSIVNHKDNSWNSVYPKSNSSSIVRSLDITIKENPLITSSVIINPSNPVSGQTVTASFEIQNTSSEPVDIGTIVLASRDPNDKNTDFEPDFDVTIPANAKYTYTKTKKLTVVGDYYYFISNFKNNTWSNNYPKPSDNTIKKDGILKIRDNPLITSSLTFSPASPIAGQPTTANLSITNSSDNEVSVGTIAVTGRTSDGKNADFMSDINVVIPANTTYSYSKTQTFANAGVYNFSISNYKDNSWNSIFPKSANNTIKRYSSLTIR